MTLGRALLGYLVAAGPYLARSATQIADLSGLGGSFVGSMFVVFSTSLPELVATLTAVWMGPPELALAQAMIYYFGV
jgi:cation:H+ antiporter